MNRIGFISVNHFWTLTHEVGFHLHNTQTALTNTSIQTALTSRSIRTENSRKKKNEERDSQVFLEFFLVEEASSMDNKRGRMGPGIGIYFVLSELASTEDERIGSNAVIRGATVWRHLPAAKPVTPLSCENAAVWFYPIEEKHSSIEHLFLKVQSMTLHRRKGTLRAFSRSFRYRGIRTSGFGRMNTWNGLFCSWICRDWDEVYDQLSGFRGSH